MRGADLVARLGGDEFAVVVDGISTPGDAGKVAQKILDQLEEPFSFEGTEILARSSIGIAAFPQDGNSPEFLVKASDTAMYEAKRLGRNNYQFFAAQMQEAAERRSILEHDLNRALRDRHFELFYQPKLHARSRRIVGAEVLLRWHHRQRGLLAPGDFMDVAEDCGIIVPLGSWILSSACRQVRAWRDSGLRGPFSLAVNVSMHQLKRDNILNSVLSTVVESGIAPGDLEIELTESAIMEDPEGAIVSLRQLHEFGVGVSIDDFGTGYSSLQNLKRLPLDNLKIDRSFVSDIGHDPDNETIVRTTINLAHNLGIKVIAEGVETQFQHDYLVNNGCDFVQGYLFGEPMQVIHFERLLDISRDSVRACSA